MQSNFVEFGDCREIMRGWKNEGIRAQMCVTSPPYFGLRDYGHAGQLGLEQTPEEYVAAMVEVFRCVRDVLADDGTLWLNLGDSYGAANNRNDARRQVGGGKNTNRDKSLGFNQGTYRKMPGIKQKDLIGIPWRVAFALQADGWYLRQDIIWHKPNPMPESVRDRCTKAHEYLFLLCKSDRYFFDSEAMREESVNAPRQREKNNGESNVDTKLRGQNGCCEVDGTRNRRSVWSVATRPYKGAHFATFPPALIEPCILAGSRPGDVVLDPFMGSGTTAAVAVKHGRRYLGCELNESYGKLQDERIRAAS